MNTQARLMKSIAQALENWSPPMEMTWDSTVASNVGYLGACRQGEPWPFRRVYANFQAEYATFKYPEGDKNVASMWFNKPERLAEQFEKLMAYLTGEA